MAYLLDTSVLVRLANVADAGHPLATWAVGKLHGRGEVLHLTPQVLIEFRNVATRPAAVNGLGLSTANAEFKAAGFEAKFPLLTDTPDIFSGMEDNREGAGNNRQTRS
jgi:predicted nucleic acid-binding protein